MTIFCTIFMLFSLTLAYEVGMLPQALPRGRASTSFGGAAAAELHADTGAGLVAMAAETLSALAEAARTPSRPSDFAHAEVQNISVVMPCFGQSAFLEEALASVIHQLYPPVEIIVVDDGSEDKCGEP